MTSIPYSESQCETSTVCALCNEYGMRIPYSFVVTEFVRNTPYS